jgi:hypothetical protein
VIIISIKNCKNIIIYELKIKGAAYVKNLGNCEMLSWNECDYIDGPREFYQNKFIETVTEFLKRRIK